MKRVFILSPLATIVEKPGQLACSVESNVAFAKRCAMNSIARGEAPFVPHLHYPQVGLDDFDAKQRALGISCGLAWLAACDVVAVYVDRGVSKGMRQELAKAKELHEGITSVGGPARIDELVAQGNYRRASQGILDLTRRTDFRRLDGGGPPTWQWLHDEKIPHLQDMNGDACPECFGGRE